MIEAALTLPNHFRPAAYRDISEITGRTEKAVRSKAYWMSLRVLQKGDSILYVGTLMIHTPSDRPALELTPAMVEAGVNALFAFDAPFLSPEIVVEEIWRALSAAAPALLRQSPVQPDQ